MTEHYTVVAHALVVCVIEVFGERTVRTGYVESVATAPGREGLGLGSLADDGDRRDRPPRANDMGALSTTARNPRVVGWERWQGRRRSSATASTVATEDDDGLMVLRFRVDLAAPITCDPRPGDGNPTTL